MLVLDYLLSYTELDSCSDYDIRLRLGPNDYSGLLEVCYGGHWGTVCGDSFNENAATVACRQLGYSEDVVVETGTPYGQGDGVIWLSDVHCEGGEAGLQECAHSKPVGNLSSTCPGHSPDVNIRCNG